MEQQTENIAIREMTDRLSNMTTEWLADSSHPCNYIRRTGVGTEVARVDRWCGGFQDPHNPVTIGWKVQVGSSVPTGVVMVKYFDGVTGEPIAKERAVATAFAEAQDQADAALEMLRSQS